MNDYLKIPVSKERAWFTIYVDHARWQEAETEDGTATFCIDISDFDHMKGVTYYTKAFAYDRCGNVSEDAEAVNVELSEVPEQDFIFPEGTKEIGDEAFLGTAVESVHINDGCKCIGRRVFAESSVEAVYFPESVQLIQDEAVPENTVIFTTAGSIAAEWAGLNGFRTVLTDTGSMD